MLLNFLIVFVFLANFWWLPIFKTNFIYGILLLILSFLLFNNKKFPKTNLIILTVFFILSLMLLIGNFDKNLNIPNPTEVKQQSIRHSLLADGMGVLFTNKFSLKFYKNWNLPISKYLRNISYAIDPNLYFFASHPREKSGIDEFEKFPPILLPFFILGFLYYLVNLQKNKLLSTYLILSMIVTGFLTPYFKLGPVLFFPFVNVLITNGLLLTLNKLKKK